MRRKLAIVAVAAALAVSLGFLVFGPSFVPDPAAAGDGAATEPARDAGMAAAPKAPGRTPRPVEPAAEGASDPGAAERQEAYVAARCAELGDLGMRNDADSLNSILAELGNRDPRIRQAAVAAAVQFHSVEAIPRLEEAALQTESGKERAAIEEAIEFLKLPTLTEAMRQAPPRVPAPR